MLRVSVAILLLSGGLAAEEPTGEAVIRAPYAGSEIVITTTPRLAGAVHSLTWAGREFINSADHGRQLQSASNFDTGANFIPEVFNPTEAGSVHDGAGPTSTSRLWSLHAEGNRLETLTQMAFWLRPDGKSQGHPARNTTALSNHWLKKSVTIGVDGHPNVIAYDVTFIVPEGERHHYGQFEAVTGYMPPEFSVFLRFDRQQRILQPLSIGPGEQADPVVLATEDGQHAMGIWSPDQPSPGFQQAGYGRFAFPAQQVVKWNCVFRVRNPDGIAAGPYRFRNRVIIGTRATVERTLDELVPVPR